MRTLSRYLRSLIVRRKLHRETDPMEKIELYFQLQELKRRP